MQRQLGRCFRKQLAALYLISALHKMNDGFFDARESCSTQVLAITMCQLLPKPLSRVFLHSGALRTAPIGGLVVEVLMGMGLLSR
mmetsp:Transcript_20335/g.41037  ORF Transcript_20335/g.41037 Transcript_20335/m.41037 type:complete len:85 (-) Transcript_20335:15-269(-)